MTTTETTMVAGGPSADPMNAMLDLDLGALPRARWTQTGLLIPEDATYEQLAELMRAMGAWHSMGAIALADCLSYCRRKGWLEQMEMDFSDMRLDPATLRQAMAVADVPVGLRHPKLDAGHYCVVAGMLIEDQMRWLQAALDGGMSPLLLKRSVAAGRVMTQEELDALSGAGSGLPNYHGVLANWERWTRRVGGIDGVLAWPEGDRRRWAQEVRPAVEKMLAFIQAAEGEPVDR